MALSVLVLIYALRELYKEDVTISTSLTHKISAKSGNRQLIRLTFETNLRNLSGEPGVVCARPALVYTELKYNGFLPWQRMSLVVHDSRAVLVHSTGSRH